MQIRRVLLGLDPARSAGATTRRGVSAVRIARLVGAAFGVALEQGIPERDVPARVLAIDLAGWLATDVDPFDLDRAVHRAIDAGAEALFLDGRGVSPGAVVRAARELAVRYQRLFPRTNEASRSARFAEVLARHAAVHDLGKPLVRADFDHARDVWQWVLRLDPDAGLEVQIAALFHDVERLDSEAEVRIEQHAADYQAFKDAHARGSGAKVRAILGGLLDERALARIAALIERHERRDLGGDEGAVLLADADALSFFSVNVCGFLRYYGEEHTRKKIAWTLARLSERGLSHLSSVRLREDLRAIVDEARRSGRRQSAA